MTDIIAHRGSKGTRPENTLLAFKEASKCGVDGIELDVQLTKDKQVVVIHDEKVDRTTDGVGYVEQMMLHEIKSLDAGSWFSPDYKNERIPLFKEVLTLLKELDFNGFLNIEFKTDKIQYEGIEKLVIKELEDTKFENKVIFSSFSKKTIANLEALHLNGAKAFISHGWLSDQRYLSREKEITGYHPKLSWIKRREKWLCELNQEVRPWTVNKEEDMRWCLNHHLSGFFTDFPKKAIEVKRIWKSNKLSSL